MRIVESIATNDRTVLERAFEARCKTVYLGKHVALTRVLGDLMLYVDTRDIILAPHLLMNGFWEFWVTQAIARHLRPGMVCADVGANVGYYTLLMAALVGPKGRVRAFEVIPETCRLLRRSAELNGFKDTVHVVACAISDVTGNVGISVPTAPDGFGHFGNVSLQGLNTRPAQGDSLVPGRVDSRTLDEMFAAVQAPDFIKIDVEGAEPLVWEGSRELRSRSNPVLCLEYEGWRKGYAEFLAKVRGEGYRVRYVDYDSSLADLPAEPDPERLYMLWLTK
jgi:FkbM family methyltransferase